MTVAKQKNIKKGEQIIDAINMIDNNWSDFALQAKVSDSHHKRIKSNLHTLKH
jgi:hypothetical protein